jgi:Zn-finger nucleic acid-binding protein
MARKNFRGISGVLIDICQDHGVWLDAGELEQIRCFIANGGLQESQDKQIQKNSEQLAHVAGQVRDLNQQIRMLHRFEMRRAIWQGVV